MPRAKTGQMITVLVAMIPLLGLVLGLLTDRLGAEPVETITHETGEWALRLLILTLLITPLRQFFGWNALAPYRRTLGLLCFFYAALHFATFLTFDLSWRIDDLLKEIRERPYITVGFFSFMILCALAITSTRGWIKRLGRSWLRLHRLVYLALVLAVVHFLWLVKVDRLEPLVYAAIASALLAWRLPLLFGRRPLTYATLRRPGEKAQKSA